MQGRLAAQGGGPTSHPPVPRPAVLGMLWRCLMEGFAAYAYAMYPGLAYPADEAGHRHPSGGAGRRTEAPTRPWMSG